MSAVIATANQLKAELGKRRGEAGNGTCSMTNDEKLAIAEAVREVYLGGHQRVGNYWITYRP